MSKTFAAVLFVAAMTCVFAAPEPVDNWIEAEDSNAKVITAPNGVTFEFRKLPEDRLKGAGLCGTCASLTGQALNILLNYVLNAGVVGGCSKLCSNLKTKTEATVCNIACDLVGIKAFVAALKKADLDPIYFCGLIHACKHDDNGAGSIKSLTVSPTSGAQGSTFAGALEVTVTNHTGAGEFSFDVSGGAQPSSGASSVYPELAPGSYGVKINIPTKPAEDPTKGPSWMPGPYVLSAAFCMGSCGSDHPHSKIFGESKANFTITPH